ncbi:Ubiquinone biosynthesis O-methyltransferase [Burkholderia lata]|uniref:Ubiquinone biosynthesis O-methyltransferase n=2 Tax=Burkholderia lata (strain ATCC 17760 / DSM 23089 / LMG 22485 / NCIMB 9086 / R18194 / 383) TaxID=482957 RepID=A0A6P2NW13_BURL3|nr:Ubiquinone biosynthesis O-methyltransferase [Burkholderia lata]
MESKLDAKAILEMAYPDFVGFINQWNVLPGAFVTLSKWANYAKISPDSNVLQVACTTGFQSRELAVLTGCRAHGIDLSSAAVEMARYNKETYAPQARVTYEVCDGYQFKSEQKYSHIAVGGGLKFFPDPARALNHAINFIEDGGFVLASPFFLKAPMPHDDLIEAEKVFGVKPTTEGYKEMMRIYKNLEIVYEDHNDIEPETEQELTEYCESTVKRAAEIHGITNEHALWAMYERLQKVRRMSNKLRSFQRYSVLVLRYRASTYPHRYVELF